MKTVSEAFKKIPMEDCFRGRQIVIVPQAISPSLDQPRATQICQMTGCGRLRNLENVDKIPYTKFSTQKQMKNAQSSFIGKCTKH
jgi:hypothetical protein